MPRILIREYTFEGTMLEMVNFTRLLTRPYSYEIQQRRGRGRGRGRGNSNLRTFRNAYQWESTQGDNNGFQETQNGNDVRQNNTGQQNEHSNMNEDFNNQFYQDNGQQYVGMNYTTEQLNDNPIMSSHVPVLSYVQPVSGTSSVVETHLETRYVLPTSSAVVGNCDVRNLANDMERVNIHSIAAVPPATQNACVPSHSNFNTSTGKVTEVASSSSMSAVHRPTTSSSNLKSKSMSLSQTDVKKDTYAEVARRMQQKEAEKARIVLQSVKKS